MHELFRKEAHAGRAESVLGAALLSPPLSFAAWSLLATILAVAVVTTLCLGEYTRRTHAVGVIVPAYGLTKLLPAQPGIVVERRVDEGQPVRSGDVLFVLSAERLTDQHGAIGGAQSVILEQLGRRRASLSEEAARQSDVTAAQLAAAARRLSDLEAESAQIGAEVSTQAARVASVRVQVQRFEELRQHEFMSELAAQVKREDLLDQLARLQSLERSRLVVAREAAALAAELKQIPLRGAQQQAELRRAAAAVEQEIAATEASRQIVVTAPHDGTITAILVDRGQTVQSGPLATLLPADTPLEAHLYVSSRAAGFVEPGQSVRIRYAAYPYQKFGQYGGRVRNVSRSALAANELPPLLAALGQQGEGLYRIAVRLDSPDVVVYGKPQPLTAGMQLDADVLQERRRLIEWVFEPLYSLRGKF